jgi:hypothetical protein
MGLLVLATWSIAAPSLTAQENEAEAINREHRIKAAYLYQLGRYVEWPSRAFSNAQSPFLIGVFSESPIGSDLLQIAQTRKIQDRPIEIRSYSASSNVATFHILFLPASLDPKIQTEIIRRTAGKHILLVGEDNTFISWGGGISFVIEENKVRLYIARKAIEQQGLTVSAKLLQVGHVVD